MKAILLSCVCALIVAGCADPEPARQREPGGQAAGERLGASQSSPTARPVSIGEGGPRFAACQGRGRVGGLRGETLAVRDAPFDAAKQVGSLPEDAHVFVCTRSLDQQWLGVVIGPVPGSPAEQPPASVEGEALPAAPAPAIDCGVTRPVRSKQAYSGPCPSGWVESTFVAAVAS
jgi:hypothetical protein